MMDRTSLEDLLRTEWGSRSKPSDPFIRPPKKLIADLAEWGDLEKDAKALVLEILADFCGCLGSAQTDDDVAWCISGLIGDLKAGYRHQSRATPLLIAAMQGILAPKDDPCLNALYTPYLFAELELRFRVRCPAHMRFTGKVIAPLPAAHSNARKLPVGKRMNNMADALELGLLTNATPLEASLRHIDKALNARARVVMDDEDERRVASLRDYFEFMRNGVVHGPLSVIGTDCYFLLFIIGLFVLFTDAYE